MGEMAEMGFDWGNIYDSGCYKGGSRHFRRSSSTRSSLHGHICEHCCAVSKEHRLYDLTKKNRAAGWQIWKDERGRWHTVCPSCSLEAAFGETPLPRKKPW